MIKATDGLCDRMRILGLIAPISRLPRSGSIGEGESETPFRGAIRGHRHINRAQLISHHQATDRGILLKFSESAKTTLAMLSQD